MRRLFIILAMMALPLMGSAQVFSAINLPTNMCAGTVDTFSFGLGSQYDIVVDTVTSTISRADRAFLPDGVPCNNTCSYSSPITFSNFAPDAVITSVNDIEYVRLNMEHSYIGDIYIGLTCPDNHRVALMKWKNYGSSSCSNNVPSDCLNWDNSYSNTSGGTYFGLPYDEEGYPACDSTVSDNHPGIGWNYCWSNSSGYSYAAQDARIYRNANSSYTSTYHKSVDSSNVAAGTNFYHPDQSFSNLIGCPVNGQWTIEVIDAYSQDNGYIFEWEMSLTSALRPSPCGLVSQTIISEYVQQLNANTFVFSAPNNIATDTVIYLTLRLTNTCGDDIDSLVPITIHANSRDTIYETACDRFTWYNHPFTYSTTALVHLISSYGCDSTVLLNLTINNSTADTITDTIVENELPYILGLDTLPSAGEYTSSYTTVDGCDSTMTFSLTVWPNIADTVDTTLCRHQLPLQYLGNQITTTEAIDTFTFVLQTAHGADSTIYLAINVLPDDDITIADTVVENNLPVTACGITWQQPVDTTLMRTNMYGCDSAIHYSLVVWYNIEQTYDTTVCANQLPMTWHNQTFTEADTMVLNLSTIHGADSTVTLMLATNPVYAESVDTILCDNMLPLVYLDSTITTPQAYIFPLNTVAGCDSTVTLSLTVLPTSDTAIADTVVQNDLPVTACGMTWQHSVDTTLMRSNVYGCDSTVHYSLVVWPNFVLAFDTTVCINQLPLHWKNQTFTEADTMVLNLNTIHGADSTVTLMLATNPVYDVRVDTSLCDNMLPLTYLDTTIMLPEAKLTSYTFHLATIAGCDSIVTLYLTVLPTTDTTIADTVVQNDLPHHFRDTVFTQSGNWQFLTTNAVGCDSTIYYSLHVWANDTIRLDTTVCSNYAPFTWHGATFATAGTTVLNLRNIHDADSIVILHAEVPPAYDTSLAIEICDNQHYFLGTLRLNTSGHYDADLLTTAGCDSVVHLDLTVYPTYSQHIYDTTCRTSAYRFLDSVYRMSGDYTHNLPTVHGCDSLLTLHLALKGIHLQAAAQISPLMPTIENKRVNLRDISHNAIDRLWMVGTLESHQKNIAIDYPEELDSLDATLIAYSDDGCADTLINIIRIDRAVIYAPNAFTPNQADNAYWSLIGEQIATLEVWIYNREGLLVHHYEGIDGSWDGNREGKPCQQGAYVYRANYTTKLHPSRTQTITGTILLIR